MMISNMLRRARGRSKYARSHRATGRLNKAHGRTVEIGEVDQLAAAAESGGGGEEKEGKPPSEHGVDG